MPRTLRRLSTAPKSCFVSLCRSSSQNRLYLSDTPSAYTASQAGLLAQLGAIRKAAELGIKLFVTCEYTLDFDEQDIKTSPYVPGKVLTQEDLDQERYPLVKLRREAVDLANELGLPVLQVHLGEFTPVM